MCFRFALCFWVNGLISWRVQDLEIGKAKFCHHEGQRQDQEWVGEQPGGVLLWVLPSQDRGGSGESLRPNGPHGSPPACFLWHYLGSWRNNLYSDLGYCQQDAKHGEVLQLIKFSPKQLWHVKGNGWTRSISSGDCHIMGRRSNSCLSLSRTDRHSMMCVFVRILC